MSSIALAIQHQIEGLQYNLTVLRTDLARIFGVGRSTPASTTHGDPTVNKQYWVALPDLITAPLATVAMAYGQLTGSTPDVAQFIERALSTDSVSSDRSGRKMYEGPGTTNAVKWTDANDLLATAPKGVRVITRNYPKSQEADALRNLETALDNPKQAVIATYWGPVDGQEDKAWKTVLVLGIDTARDIVEFNDPTMADGQDFKMSLKEFVRLWAIDSYQTVTVQLAALPAQSSSAAPAVAAA